MVMFGFLDFSLFTSSPPELSLPQNPQAAEEFIPKRASPTYMKAVVVALLTPIVFIAGFQGTSALFSPPSNHCHRRFRCGRISRSINFCSQFKNEGDHPSSKKSRSSTPGAMGETASSKGTLYVTVGPQCAGKTTILKILFGKSVRENEENIAESMSSDNSSGAGVDIAIDDQDLVYIPVPTSYFLQSSPINEYPSLNQTIYGKTIRDRIHDPSNKELVLVLLRLGGTLGAEEFAFRLQGQNSGDTFDKKPAQVDLIDAIEHVIQLHATGEEGDDNNVSAPIPKAIDLFVAESIFRPRPLELLHQMANECTKKHTSTSLEALSALDQALYLLKTHAVNPDVHPSAACLSWGNTNTRPREFQSALEAAALSGRTVEFIVFGGIEACELIRERMSRREYRKMSHVNEAVADKENSSDKQMRLFLPKVDRKTLFIRNLRRFLQTGRYIPSNAIADAMIRVESLLAEAVAEAIKDYPNEDNGSEIEPKSMHSAKFWLDFELAKLAGYHLNQNRTVSSVNVHHDSSRSSHQPHSGGGGRWQPPAGHRDGRGYGGRGERSNLNHNRQGRQQITSNNNLGRGYEQAYRQDSNRQAKSGGGGDTNYQGREDGRKRGHDGN